MKHLALCLLLVQLLAPIARAATDSAHLLIPGSAGGGWDRTARAVGQTLTATRLLDRVRYENLAGGGGGKAIAHLIELGRADMLMVNSTPIVARSLQGVFPHSFRDLQPIASIIGDYSVIAVRAQSSINTLMELAELQQSNPRNTPIAGGSIRGSTDHIVAAMTFRGFGADANTVKYIPYDTGGKAMVGLLSGEVRALSSGYGEVADLVGQGWVRILCIAAEQRLPQAPDTPTCEEAGSKGTYFVNWRGFFAPPNVEDATVAMWTRKLAALTETKEWQLVIERYGWVPLFRSGDDFEQLLVDQERQLRILLTDLRLL